MRAYEREAEAFQHALAELRKLLAAETETGPVAYANFVGERNEAVQAYAAFLACLVQGP